MTKLDAIVLCCLIGAVIGSLLGLAIPRNQIPKWQLWRPND